MTKQTKHYIELSDILALRFDCKNCGATLVIDARKNFSVPPRICVNCKEDLWAYEDASVDDAARRFVDNLKMWQRIMENPTRIRFSFLLEVKGEEAKQGEQPK